MPDLKLKKYIFVFVQHFLSYWLLLPVDHFLVNIKQCCPPRSYCVFKFICITKSILHNYYAEMHVKFPTIQSPIWHCKLGVPVML